MISLTFSVGGVSQIGTKVVKEPWLVNKRLKYHDRSKKRGLKPDVRKNGVKEI